MGYLIVRVQEDFDDEPTQVTAALKTEGFGVLTEVDGKDALKKKFNVDFRPYKILGACHPPPAYRALSAAPEIGLLLLCKVTDAYVAENVSQISIIDPLSMLGFVQHPDLEPVAEEARTRLDRVAAALA